MIKPPFRAILPNNRLNSIRKMSTKILRPSDIPTWKQLAKEKKILPVEDNFFKYRPELNEKIRIHTGECVRGRRL